MTNRDWIQQIYPNLDTATLLAYSDWLIEREQVDEARYYRWLSEHKQYIRDAREDIQSHFELNWDGLFDNNFIHNLFFVGSDYYVYSIYELDAIGKCLFIEAYHAGKVL